MNNTGRIIKARNLANQFTQIPNKTLQDPDISWRAKGLLAYLLSLPEDWAIYLTELHKHSTEGRDSTIKAFKELIVQGYITVQENRTARGTFKGSNYTVYPFPENQCTVNSPVTENPFPDNPKPDNPNTVVQSLQTNTPLTNIDTNKQELKKQFDYQLPFSSELFMNAWNDWVKDRKDRKKKLTALAIERQLKMLATFTETAAIKMINIAIEKGWTGLFPVKDDKVDSLTEHQINMKNRFEDFYVHQTSIGYEWKSEDNEAIVKLISFFKKRSADRATKQSLILSSEDLDKQCLDSFESFLALLNSFHRKRFLSPFLLYKNINTIITEISHESRISNDPTKANTASDYV